MSVKQRANGKWYCRFSFNGKDMHRLCRGATTKSKAEEIERAIIYDLKLQELGYKPKEQKKVYMPRLIELYTIHSKNNHKNFESKVYYLNAIEKYFGDNKSVNDITPEDIEKYKRYLKETGKLKNSSTNRHLEILSKMFNLAIANKELVENPVSKVEKLREDNHTIRFLTKDEEKRLFTSIVNIAPYIKPIVITALQTGMRKGEIFNLKWSNIKCGYIELLETKSGKMRNIPISSTLKDVFAHIQKTSEYVFINPDTDKPYRDIKKSWYNIRKDANLLDFRFHDLRHTVATRMVEKGIDLLVVKDILGHTMIETTMRYAHPVPERKKAAIEVLNSYT